MLEQQKIIEGSTLLPGFAHGTKGWSGRARQARFTVAANDDIGSLSNMPMAIALVLSRSSLGALVFFNVVTHSVRLLSDRAEPLSRLDRDRR